MAVVIASNLRKELAGSLLFDGVSFKVERRDRVALAGPNGAGKTTLLRMLAGQTEVQGGELAFAKGTRVALHDQRPPLQRGMTLREYVLSGASDLVAIEQELRRLEDAMAGGDHAQQTLRRYAEAQARLEHAGGYAWRERIGSVAHGLGFREQDLDRVLDTFSGGELTRASLARALGSDPDLLLLDEPTNHLDVASLEWLENELSSLDAAVILVAHDRWFLEATTTAVLELEAGRSTYFAGPWHQWRLEKAARLQAATKEAARYAEDIARLERFVERFRYKKTKARQAQAKLTQIERLSKEKSQVSDEISLLSRRSKRLGFGFINPARSGRTVAEADDLVLQIGERTLLEHASFALERGEHVALVGPNGSGKTTLLETLLGRRNAAGGRVRIGHSVQVGYFSQQEVELDERHTVLESTQRATGLQRPQAQALLGRFLFSGWSEHEKSVSVLSGGERRRLALAHVVASGANFLVLDEPTNHLDLESREALEAALDAFPGTILLVSHDRALVDAVAERTLALEDLSVRSYDGGWAEYVRRREEQAARVRGSEPQTPPEPAAKPKKRASGSEPQTRTRPARTRPSELERLEADVSAREVEVAELERKLADDWADVETLQAYRRAHDELQALLERWEKLFEKSQAR
jgi:ATP-binding cassette, subfamily F, member 3